MACHKPASCWPRRLIKYICSAARPEVSFDLTACGKPRTLCENLNGFNCKMKPVVILTLIYLSALGCTKTVSCGDLNIQMAFIGFTPSDSDTIVLRKFQTGDNYQYLIDTLNIFFDSSLYHRFSDTTFVSLNEPGQGIKAYNDWQIFIPSTNRTLRISAIVTEQATTKCSTLGETLNCNCINKIYSLKNDNIFVDLSSLNQYLNPYVVYVNK